jgi:hypothetical protein
VRAFTLQSGARLCKEHARDEPVLVIKGVDEGMMSTLDVRVATDSLFPDDFVKTGTPLLACSPGSIGPKDCLQPCLLVPSRLAATSAKPYFWGPWEEWYSLWVPEAYSFPVWVRRCRPWPTTALYRRKRRL